MARAVLYSALIGNPVEQSVTPILYGALAAHFGLEYAHLKIPITDPGRVPEVIAALEAIGAIGVNVTIPYKVSVMALLDTLDPSTDIGAVNTVAFRDGKRIGFNTDRTGAARAIDENLRPIKAGDRIVLLGAGGAARAIVGIAKERRATLVVLSPWPEECAQLVNDMDPDHRVVVEAEALTHQALRQHLAEADFLINATPVGAAAGPAGTLVSAGLWQELAAMRDISRLHVLDVIYAPVRTTLLEDAARVGARTCSGLWMLVNQGVDSFGILTERGTGAIDRAPLFALLGPGGHTEASAP
jgi:shikimate dehydrogenase